MGEGGWSGGGGWGRGSMGEGVVTCDVTVFLSLTGQGTPNSCQVIKSDESLDSKHTSFLSDFFFFHFCNLIILFLGIVVLHAAPAYLPSFCLQ